MSGLAKKSLLGRMRNIPALGSTVLGVLGGAALPTEVKSLEWGGGQVRYLQPYPACTFSPVL